MIKTTDKKNANKKNIILLKSANEAAACLVALANKDRYENFSSLEEMQAHMREELTEEKKELANESSEEESYNDDDDE